ncbi:hypothetical protein [Parvicella tangerina]|uniref:Uncharacterized protein n=1 Tax=Parvicella tangerina TaxID=2829795 RepID=A0A916JSB8_9FLAO|nr:hypothetical protein [Parvicella tangerina]CAG5086851.1 hypothetical protein CRYO30217_03306 [Parvicella tangerina]
MEVEFEVVRFGKIRSDRFIEKTLQENVELLKNSIRSFLSEDNSVDKVYLDIIIPSRGQDIKVNIFHIKEDHVKNRLKFNYPNSIYTGSQTKLIENAQNQVWK